MQLRVAEVAESTAGGAVVTAAGGAVEYIQWSCRWCSREISVELRMIAAIFTAILTCAAACVSGGSSIDHCRWCSGDSCRWRSRVHSVELQVVQQRDFSGAADDSSDIFSGFWWSYAW